MTITGKIKMLTQIEKEIENNGLEFSLKIDEIPVRMYDDLLSQMIEYLNQCSHKSPEYIGNWEVIIKAKDIQFERE